MCMHACVCGFACVHMHVCVSIYACVPVYVCVCLFMCVIMPVCVFACACLHVHVCVSVHACVGMHACTCVGRDLSLDLSIEVQLIWLAREPWYSPVSSPNPGLTDTCCHAWFLHGYEGLELVSSCLCKLSHVLRPQQMPTERSVTLGAILGPDDRLVKSVRTGLSWVSKHTAAVARWCIF